MVYCLTTGAAIKRVCLLCANWYSPDFHSPWLLPIYQIKNVSKTKTQMSITLNEFTREQLEFALKMFTEQTETLQLNLMKVELWDDSLVRDDLMKEYNLDLDIATLWRVQLMNALDEVKSKEKELSN